MTHHCTPEGAVLSRRSFIGSTASGVVALAGARALLRNAGSPAAPVRAFALTAAPGHWDVGGRSHGEAWMYNGQRPGPELRVREGDVVRVTLTNALPEPTTIHWHGMPVPFSMDGVPELTQRAVAPGNTFTYEFVAATPGTYWYHSHYGYQIERGLLGALIVEPRHEALVYDREFTLVLGDWLANVDRIVPSVSPYNFIVGGVAMGAVDMSAMGAMEDEAGTPDLAAPRSSIAQHGYAHAAHGMPMREPVFDGYTVNGRLAVDAMELVIRRGERIRLRMINASTAAVFPVYLAGHRLTVTHSDGQPITPFDTDVVAIGMGERVDAIVDAANVGIWRLGSTDARHRAKGFGAIVRYAEARDGTLRDATFLPAVSKTPYRSMIGAEPQSLERVDRTYELVLRRQDNSRWLINDKAYPATERLEVREGERIRVRISNHTPFAHPIHLHGHFVDLVRPYGAETNVAQPLRKDTLTLYHMDEHTIEFTANNPGPRWFLHCHNQYHHVGGMATEVVYRT